MSQAEGTGSRSPGVWDNPCDNYSEAENSDSRYPDSQIGGGRVSLVP